MKPTVFNFFGTLMIFLCLHILLVEMHNILKYIFLNESNYFLFVSTYIKKVQNFYALCSASLYNYSNIFDTEFFLNVLLVFIQTLYLIFCNYVNFSTNCELLIVFFIKIQSTLHLYFFY